MANLEHSWARNQHYLANNVSEPHFSTLNASVVPFLEGLKLKKFPAHLPTASGRSPDELLAGLLKDLEQSCLFQTDHGDRIKEQLTRNSREHPVTQLRELLKYLGEYTQVPTPVLHLHLTNPLEPDIAGVLSSIGNIQHAQFIVTSTMGQIEQPSRYKPFSNIFIDIMSPNSKVSVHT